MSGLIAMWRDNPVMVKEFRVRMRGARAYWIITGYLLFLSFILFMQYTLWWNRTQAEGHNLASGSKIGQEFLTWLTVTQAFLVAFITPAITSGAITIEREQRTLEMLELTRLTPGQVILGKLSSAVGFVILLLISSVPLASICFFLGGVSPEQIGYTYLMLAAGAFLAGTLGIVWSSVARTTAAAVILTYATLLLPVVFVFTFALMTSMLGPAFEIELVLANLLATFGIPVPLQEFSPIAPYYQYWDQVRYFGLTVPRWLPGLLSFTMVGLVLAAAAAVRIAARPEKKSGLLRGLVVLVFVEQMFFFFGARFSAYASGAPASIGQLLDSYPVTLHLLYPVLLLLIVAPIFSTGDLRPAEARGFIRHLAGGWKKAGWGTARITAGWPYLCVLVGVVLGMFAFSFLVSGHGSKAMSGRINVSGRAAPVLAIPPPFRSGMTLVPQPVPAPSRPIGGLPQIALMLLATVTGVYFMGVFLSLACGNRWIAMMLMYAGLLLVLMWPSTNYTGYRNDSSAGPSAVLNLFYLNPLYSIAQMSDNSNGALSRVPLLFGRTPAWQVTTILYAILSAIFMALAAPLVTRIAAKSVLPYEDIDARA